MKALVVGYGSIGSRHAALLAELGCQVAVTSSRDVEHDPHYQSVPAAVRDFAPDYAVIASQTALHHQDALALAASGFHGSLLVEKPLFHAPADLSTDCFRSVHVAYNLRFHPLLQRLRALLQGDRVLSLQAYVGQYLPQWRPGRDYRLVYSAHRGGGGGVLRDLSHELDLMNWLLGGWQRVTAIGGRFSDLEIDSDDLYTLMLSFARCPAATLELNYLDRVGTRRITVNTQAASYHADLVAGTLTLNGAREEYPVDRNHSYREMHRALLEGRTGDLCSYPEGCDVVAMIDAAEQAAGKGTWISK